jgi:hypothetical protein
MNDMSWSLGDDYDCETCGYTYNTLRLEDYDDDLWVLTMHVGCYGGESTSSDKVMFAQEAEEIIQECLGYENFSEADAENVRNAIKEITGA